MTGCLRSFASPFFNRRTDGYGGSFENRMRISLEVFEAIKKAVGDSVPLGVRLCVSEFTIFGYDSEYGLQIAEHFQNERLRRLLQFRRRLAFPAIGWRFRRPPSPQEDFRKINRELKGMSKLPVVAFGRMNSPQLAEETLRSGEGDLIGMARQLIADPGRRTRPAATAPTSSAAASPATTPASHQASQEICRSAACKIPAPAVSARSTNACSRPIDRALKVVVAGGGPAGLKVAETAARRGHHVTLLERERALGGQLLLAEKQPEHANVTEVTSYLELVAAECGVDLRRGPRSHGRYGAPSWRPTSSSSPRAPSPTCRASAIATPACRSDWAATSCPRSTVSIAISSCRPTT